MGLRLRELVFGVVVSVVGSVVLPTVILAKVIFNHDPEKLYCTGIGHSDALELRRTRRSRV